MLRDLLLSLGGYMAGVGATLAASWLAATGRRLQAKVVVVRTPLIGSRSLWNPQIPTPDDLVAQKAEVAVRILARRAQRLGARRSLR